MPVDEASEVTLLMTEQEDRRMTAAEAAARRLNTFMTDEISL